MSPKKITVVDASGQLRKKKLSNEEGFRNLLSEFGVAHVKDVEGVEIEDFESLENADMYTLGDQQQRFYGGDSAIFTEEYTERLWQSVLRITSDIEGDSATALVFDVYGSFLYLLANEHYHLIDGNTYCLEYCGIDNTFSEVDNFQRNEFVVYASSKENDFVIYKLPLSDDIWDAGVGMATRKPVPDTKRPRRGQQPAERPKASVICKTPSFWYEGIHPADEVRVYALPGAVPGRWVSQTRVTHVGRLVFYLQALSAPGGSRGAVLATSTGHVVGFVGGAYDVEEPDSKHGKKMVERRFNAFTFSILALPARLSSIDIE